jgi:PUA-domain protein
MKKQLSKSEKKTLNDSITHFGIFFEKQDNIEETDSPSRIILKSGIPWLFFHNDTWVPTLYSSAKLKQVFVDKGAIPFIIKGADIMRPGVLGWDENIAKNEIVIVCDNEHKKPLMIGISLWDSVEYTSITTGKCVKNIHFVGDKIWSLRA